MYLHESYSVTCLLYGNIMSIIDFMKVQLSVQLGKKDTKLKEDKDNQTSRPSKPVWRRGKFIFFTIYFIALFLFIYIGSQPSHYLGKEYSDSTNGFSITPPKKWTTKQNQDNSLIEFVDPKDSFIKIKVNIDQTDQKLSDYISLIKQTMPQAMPSFSILNEFDTTIGGLPAHVIDGEAQVNLVWEKNRVVVIVKDSKAYSVAASTKLNDWDTNKYVLLSSLKTFQLK